MTSKTTSWTLQAHVMGDHAGAYRVPACPLCNVPQPPVLTHTERLERLRQAARRLIDQHVSGRIGVPESEAPWTAPSDAFLALWDALRAVERGSE